jgi:predicted porin
MYKKLIVLLFTFALGAPMLAFAQGTGVTFFGRIQTEYFSTKIDQGPGASDYRQEAIADNQDTSRWGLAITEDLGNGLNANARIEFAFRTGNGVADSAREQWVGLSSKNWGAVQFGRINGIFKDFAGGATIDPFLGSSLQARGSGGAMYSPLNSFGVGAFVDHAIRYNSPEFGGGFTAAVLLSPSDATQAAGGTGGNVGGRGGANNYQLALKYKFGAAGDVFVGYSQDDANDAQRALPPVNGRTADDEQVWRIGGAWNYGNFRVAGQYENIENALAGNGGTTCDGGSSSGGGDAGISTVQCNTALNTNGEGDIWFLTLQYKLGKTTLVAQGGQTNADAIGTSVEREATNVTLGAIYNFSKRTRVFGGYQKVDIEGGRNIANDPDSTQAQVDAAVQPDRSTWVVGLRHDF